MKKKTLLPLLQGLTATSLALVTVCVAGHGVANTWRNNVDAAFGQSSYVTDTSSMTYTSDYSTPKALYEAAKEYAINEGEEGTVVLKNDNSVLPLASGSKVALMGSASYMTYFSAAGNSDQISLSEALVNNGLTLDSTLSTVYAGAAENYTDTTTWGTTTRTYNLGPNDSAPDYDTYDIHELNPSYFTNANVVMSGAQSSGWENNVDADTAIVTFARPGGEGTTYKPGATSQWSIAEDGTITNNATTLDQDPLQFGPDELAVIKKAKELAEKVVVLLNTSVAMDIGPLVDSKWNVDPTDTTDYTVDGIAYIGVPNDYQLQGTANVLTGKVNATGALADTYAVSSSNDPAMQNFGGAAFRDYQSLTSESVGDSRWSNVNNLLSSSSFSRADTYNGGLYLIEAENIYTGYTYYETRYYDSVVGQGNATSSTGSLTGGAWDYDEEVVYPFGHGLSYYEYDEELVSVSYTPRGDVEATVRVTNNSDTAATFRSELFVQAPYSDYDKQNGVEKSAAQFLNSAKVYVGANSSETVTISVPSKYLASYDANGYGTYILDGGTYYFALGNGSHEAVNNILTAQNHLTGSTNDVYALEIGTSGEVDATTYAVSDSGGAIENQMETVDINYWFDDYTTYFSRSDWSGTYPENYVDTGETITDSLAETDLPLGELSMSDIADSKYEDYIDRLIGRVYDYNLTSNGDDVTNWDGVAGVTWSDLSKSTDYQDIDADIYEELVQAIPAYEAVGAILHGGSASDTLSNIENPVVVQNDGPTGFTSGSLGEVTDETSPYYFTADGEYADYYGWGVNINSQTLLGSSFNPEVASEWGKILGNTGLWTGRYEIWGAGLNYHRTQYNGRNNEYPSEDPMLTNRIGAAMIEACNKTGVICGPKHIGFNDQEYDRSGIQVYMNEQKYRETDMRAFQGAIEDEGALGAMIAFNRVGPTNATQSYEMINGIMRGEWGFKGLISSDMCMSYYYFSGPDAIYGGTTMLADFASGDSTIGTDSDGTDTNWTYITRDNLKFNNTLVEIARDNLRYQLYAFANSAVLNIATTYVMPGWELGLNVLTGVFAGVAAISGCAWIGLGVLNVLKKEEK